MAWAPLERAALAAVDETADEGAVSDATWDTLAELVRESELIELLMLIGHYLMLTTVLRLAAAPARAPGRGAGRRACPAGPVHACRR